MATIEPEVVLQLTQQLLADTGTIDELVQTMPNKIQLMEEGAAGLDAVASATENFQQAMQALRQVSANLDQERTFLQSLAQQMEELIRLRGPK